MDKNLRRIIGDLAEKMFDANLNSGRKL